MKGKVLSCLIGFCMTKLSLSKVCKAWGGGEGERATGHQQDFIGTQYNCEGGWLTEDFGVHFVQVGVFLPSPPACHPPLSSLFPLCWGCGTVTTQLTHYLISIPFYSCINLLLLPVRNVHSQQLMLTCSASQPPEMQERGKKAACAVATARREKGQSLEKKR